MGKNYNNSDIGDGPLERNIGSSSQKMILNKRQSDKNSTYLMSASFRVVHIPRNPGKNVIKPKEKEAEGRFKVQDEDMIEATTIEQEKQPCLSQSTLQEEDHEDESDDDQINNVSKIPGVDSYLGLSDTEAFCRTQNLGSNSKGFPEPPSCLAVSWFQNFGMGSRKPDRPIKRDEEKGQTQTDKHVCNTFYGSSDDSDNREDFSTRSRSTFSKKVKSKILKITMGSAKEIPRNPIESEFSSAPIIASPSYLKRLAKSYRTNSNAAHTEE